MSEKEHLSYWQMVWRQFRTHPTGVFALAVVVLFAMVGLYAPLLASSKPLLVLYDGQLYFPLARYLFFPGFFTKRLDIFFNLLMFTVPLSALFLYLRKYAFIGVALCAQVFFFVFFAFGDPVDPASDAALNSQRQERIQKGGRSDPYLYSWQFELDSSNSYAKLNSVLRHWLRRSQDQRFQLYAKPYAEQERREWLAVAVMERLSQKRPEDGNLSREALEVKILEEADSKALEERLAIPTLWRVDLQNDEQEVAKAEATLAVSSSPQKRLEAQGSLDYIHERRAWLEAEAEKLQWVVMPLLRPFHWEDDAGGEQDVNRYVDWWELTRINRKDLMAALLFGVRVSLVVGITSVALALAIGVPIGAAAGYFGGRFDIIVSRLLEIWESMPVLFMLLMVVAVTQTKSIFLVIAVVGIFGWTGFSRFIRGEFFKQRNLPYVEACTALGYSQARTIFTHILPNAIPPLLTLLPFAIMGAITSEAGLSFLGLGEEGSCSWGVLMDEGRTAFPGESYLLWPPAAMLTALLVAIALVGDALRDALDPKMRS